MDKKQEIKFYMFCFYEGDDLCMSTEMSYVDLVK